MSMKTRTGAMIAAAAVAMTLTLTACGGDDSGGGSTAAGTGDASLAEASLSYPSVPTSFDPTQTVTAIDAAVAGQFGGTLTKLALDGSIKENLAESVELSEDYLTATVTLREGLTFSDGSELTAADVAATFTRHMAVEGSTINSLMSRIVSVEATDGLTALFTFEAPFPSFREAVAMEGAAIFPAAGLAKGDSFFDLPISAGQYKLTSPWANNKLVLEVNENYWDGEPAIGKLTFNSIEDANSAMSQLKSGQLQFSADLPPNYITQLKDVDGVEANNIAGWGFYDLRLNNRVAPLDDAKVRKAISLGLDREALVEAFWAGDNDALAGFWPKTLDGYDASYKTARDLDGAKTSLEGTACADGCEIGFMYSDADFPFASQLALVFQSQMKEIGIDIQLEKVDMATLVDRLMAGDFDIAPGANNSGGDFPDKLVLDALLSTGGIKAEFTGYANPEMDVLVDQVVNTGGEQRTAAMEQINELFDKDQPFVTYATRVRGQASRLPADVISLVGSSLVIAGK